MPNKNKKVCTVCKKLISKQGMSNHMKAHQRDEEIANKAVNEQQAMTLAYDPLTEKIRSLENQNRKMQSDLNIMRNRYDAMRESMSSFGRLIAVFMGESTE